MNPPMNPNQGISYISHSRGVPSLPMMLGSGSQASMHIPPTLDSLNDFPSLGDTTINQFSQAQMASRTDYSGMVRDNGMAPVNQIEFNIQSEDFPALPGVAPGSNVSNNSNVRDQNTIQGGPGVNVNNQPNVGLSGDESQNSANDSNSSTFLQQQHHLQGQTSHDYSFGTPLLNVCYKFACHPDFEKEVSLHYASSSNDLAGQSAFSSKFSFSTSQQSSSAVGSKQFSNDGDNSTTSNSNRPNLFPKTLLKNPYGMLGLLQSIREKPFYGIDLTTLGQEVYPSDNNSLGGFATSLFCDIKPRVFEREVNVPDEYHVWNDVASKMPKLQQLFSKFSEESLFISFYLFSGSKFQRFAANALFSKDWRFHKSEKIWLRRQSSPYEETSDYECGCYCYFDLNQWKLLYKDMRVVYQCLELDLKNEDNTTSSVTA